MVKRLLICTPCVDSRPIMPWVQSVDRAKQELADQVAIDMLPGCDSSLLSDTRNILVAMFRQEAMADAMLFIDADESFTPRDVMAIVRGIDAGMPIVGAAYAKKVINWQAIHAAVLAGASPFELARMGSTKHNFAVTTEAAWTRTLHVKRIPHPSGAYDYVEAEFCGTGFLGISRAAVDRLRVLLNKVYTVRGLDGPLEVPAFFEDYANEHGFVGEDVHFCRLARKFFPIHVFIDSQIEHWGSYAHPANGRGALEAAGYKLEMTP
jgi:hypothetical protein